MYQNIEINYYMNIYINKVIHLEDQGVTLNDDLIFFKSKQIYRIHDILIRPSMQKRPMTFFCKKKLISISEK